MSHCGVLHGTTCLSGIFLLFFFFWGTHGNAQNTCHPCGSIHVDEMWNHVPLYTFTTESHLSVRKLIPHLTWSQDSNYSSFDILSIFANMLVFQNSPFGCRHPSKSQVRCVQKIEKLQVFDHIPSVYVSFIHSFLTCFNILSSSG